jgi:hypothetical protein
MASWLRKRRQQRSGQGADAIIGAANKRGVPVIRATASEAEDTAIAVAEQLYEQGQVADAEQGLRDIVAHGSPLAASRAAFSLGVMLKVRGDTAGCRERLSFCPRLD